MKRHELVTFGDVTQHILPSISVKEGLINYCIFLKPYIFLYFKYVHALSLSLRIARVLNHIYVDYITLHYITYCNAALHYYGILQLALYI